MIEHLTLSRLRVRGVLYRPRSVDIRIHLFCVSFKTRRPRVSPSLQLSGVYQIGEV